MANESTLLGELSCPIDQVANNNEILRKAGNLVTVFDRHNITISNFDRHVHYESYAAFAKRLRFTEEEIFVDFSKQFIEKMPPVKVFGVRLIFFPQAVQGIYQYQSTFENGLWEMPGKGEWLDKRLN